MEIHSTSRSQASFEINSSLDKLKKNEPPKKALVLPALKRD